MSTVHLIAAPLSFMLGWFLCRWSMLQRQKDAFDAVRAGLRELEVRTTDQELAYHKAFTEEMMKHRHPTK